MERRRKGQALTVWIIIISALYFMACARAAWTTDYWEPNVIMIEVDE